VRDGDWPPFFPHDFSTLCLGRTFFFAANRKGEEMMRQRVWRKIGTTLWVMLVALSLLAGCAPASPDPAGDDSLNKTGSVRYPLTLKDSMGNEVTIPKEPKRIVSLIPSNTEILFALGLGDKVVGVTTNDNYPAEVKKLPKVGDFQINVEKVVAQKPDLVVAQSGNDPATIDQLKKLKFPVLVLDAKSINDVYKSIDLVSQATNRTQEGDRLIAQMEKKKQDISAKVANISKEKRVKVWVELDSNLFSVGGDTFMNELVTLAGGENVAKGLKGWPQVSSEQVVKWNPDVILSTYGGDKEILARKGWESVSAVKNKRVYSLHPDLTNRPGPRVIQGVEEIAKRLYPEQFK